MSKLTTLLTSSILLYAGLASAALFPGQQPNEEAPTFTITNSVGQLKNIKITTAGAIGEFKDKEIAANSKFKVWADPDLHQFQLTITAPMPTADDKDCASSLTVVANSTLDKWDPTLKNPITGGCPVKVDGEWAIWRIKGAKTAYNPTGHAYALTVFLEKSSGYTPKSQ